MRISSYTTWIILLSQLLQRSYKKSFPSSLISFSGETKKDNKLELVSPRNRLKFEITRDIYKKDMKFELSKVHSKKTFNIVGDHILNFSMLRTKKQNRIGQKRGIGAEIIDTIHIIGIQNKEFSF